jgi:hypothetical protein
MVKLSEFEYTLHLYYRHYVYILINYNKSFGSYVLYIIFNNYNQHPPSENPSYATALNRQALKG